MIVNKYIEPSFNSEGFNSPHCDFYAQQTWSAGFYIIRGYTQINDLFVSFCSKCNNYSVWIDQKMIYPISSIAPLPLDEMPEEVKEDYLEARNIVNLSPRGASALLRLSLQKLMPLIGGKGKNINEDIGTLVKKGLPVKIQQALDSLRVIGNECVHPGELDLKDDLDTAQALFKVLNVIVHVMIVQPKEIKQLYDGLPKDKIIGIKNRDK